jgi:hypothetical protein
MEFSQRLLHSFVCRGIVVSGLCAGLMACWGDDTIPLPGVPPTPVVRLLPEAVAVAVGDTARFVVEVTVQGEPRVPVVASCAMTSATLATAVRTPTTCNVVGVSPGTTSLVVTVSTGQMDTATVVVIPR